MSSGIREGVGGVSCSEARRGIMALGAAAILLLAACGGGETSEPIAAADVEGGSSSPTEVESESLSPTEADEGWFVRTIAPLGDERGLCIDLPGWTPTNINFDAPVISHTCKHGWWNMDGRFDRAALGEGRLEAASSRLGSGFFAKPCDDGPQQRFVHRETGHLVVANDPELCISVPDEPHRDAGGDDW